MDEKNAECIFCSKLEDELNETVLIDMNMNSVVVDGDGLLEFSDLLKNLFGAKVCLHFVEY